MFQLLQYMQALWKKAAASNIPDVLEGAKSMVFSEGPGETLKVQNIDKEEQEQNAIRNWLETTRQIGYVCDTAIFLWITGYRM
jgi:SpoU rRNA methylase family enzyme